MGKKRVKVSRTLRTRIFIPLCQVVNYLYAICPQSNICFFALLLCLLCTKHQSRMVMNCFFLRGIFLDFFIFMYVIQHSFICRPFRVHCVGGCWDRTQDCCDFGIDRYKRYNHSARSPPHFFHIHFQQCRREEKTVKGG